ncbi:MAG TPA: hypothetical protein VIW94_10575 [Acidimicrobiia bacterium]
MTFVVLSAGCWRFEERIGPPAVRNDLNESVEVFLIGEDGSEDSMPAPLPPGSSAGISQAVSSEGCTTKILVARFDDGTEVEQRDPGLCEEEVWIVNGDTSD